MTLLLDSLRAPRVPAVVKQCLIVLAAIGVYFSVRHLTEGDAITAHHNAEWIVQLERELGIFVELPFQSWALSVDGVLTAANTIYIWGHWPVIGLVLGWLAWRRREAFAVYRNALLISGLVGMIIVALFPVAPPRLLDLGFVDTITMHSESYRVFQPPSLTNQYAAMPSFHVGWDLIIGIALVREGRSLWVRVAGWMLPILMLLAVVVTGNHYFVDAIVGDVIVLASLALALRLTKQGALAAQAAAPSTMPGDIRNRDCLTPSG